MSLYFSKHIKQVQVTNKFQVGPEKSMQGKHMESLYMIWFFYIGQTAKQEYKKDTVKIWS